MKTRPLVFIICVALCAKTLDCKLIGGKHDGVSSTDTRQSASKARVVQSTADLDAGSGSDADVDIGSVDTGDEYPVEQPENGSADVELTTCEMLYNERQRDNKGIIGAYIPQCTENGQFVPVQCHASTGQCWCVDASGRQLPGTMRIRLEKPDCTDRMDINTARSRVPNVDRSRQPVVTRSPIFDDGIVIDRKTGPPPPANSDFDVIVPNVDEEDSDVEYSESRVAFASRGLLNHPGILAAIVGGSVLIILCIVLLIMFVVYRMRKKDEGSYALDDEPKKKLTGSLNGGGFTKDPHSPQIVYTKAPENDREFYA